MWLTGALTADEPVALPGHVLSGFMRIVTNPRVFAPPTPPGEAAHFVEALGAAPSAARPRLADPHVDTCLRLCVEVNAKGNLVADAYLAAIAIDLDALLVTTDRDFARFPGLPWRHPLG